MTLEEALVSPSRSPSKPRVLVVILNYNGREMLRDCIRSLHSVGYPYTLAVVDNASTDDSLVEVPNGSVVFALSENKGYAGGNNVAIEYALEQGYDYVLLLNNDTLVDPCFLETLVRTAEVSPRFAFFSPKVLYANGKISFAGGMIDPWRGRAIHVGDGEQDVGQYDDNVVIDYSEGSCLLCRCSALRDVGVLDEEFFIYWEEADLCARAWKKGWLSMSVGRAKIWHLISATGGNPYLLTRNRFRYLRRHTSRFQYTASTMYYVCWDGPRLLLHYLKTGDVQRARRLLRGVYDGVIR